jgi:hypothetical protein
MAYRRFTNHRILFIFIVLISTITTAQRYPVSEIAAALKNDANAVIRLDKTLIQLDDYDNMTMTSHLVVTVFNKLGEAIVDPSISFNKNGNVKTCLVNLYDEKGELIDRFKKNDFEEVSASGSDLYTDEKEKELNFTTPKYPYTFEFYYEFKTSNTAFLPRFVPIGYTGVSIEKSEFKIHNESDSKMSVHEYNFEGYDIDKQATSNSVSYALHNFKAIDYEYYTPSPLEFLPISYFTLSKFNLEGQEVIINSWQDFGQWQAQKLLKDRDKLPQETINEVALLVKDLDNTRDKAKAIYEYVQGKTRYVSIQIGLGGWQPAAAEEVDRLSYGDCKGLTNYTMALLKSQGIESYYTIVEALSDGRDLNEEVLALQGNHVILTVPLEDENVFLECTSQTSPFNFLGVHTDDRKALMITPTGAEFVQTHSYATEDNRVKIDSELVFDDEFMLKGKLERRSYGIPYDYISEIENGRQNDIRMYYKRYWGYLNDLKFSEVIFKNDKENVEFTEITNLQTTNYVSKAGNRILLNPNVFSRWTDIPEQDLKRDIGIEIRRGKTYIDQISIKLPESYKIESFFDPVKLETKFGNYSSSVKFSEDNTLIYTRKFVLESGKYESAEYSDFRDFFIQIAKNDNSKIVLIKND